MAQQSNQSEGASLLHQEDLLDQEHGYIARELNNLCMHLKLSPFIPRIRHFNGNGGQALEDWLLDMEMCELICHGNEDCMRFISLLSLEGPASDFVMRTVGSQPRVTWDGIKACILEHYGDLIEDNERETIY